MRRSASAKPVLDFEEDFGAVPFEKSPFVLSQNTKLLSLALQKHASNRTLRIPADRTFYLQHGVKAEFVQHAVIQLDGSLHFQRTHHETDDDETGNRPSPCLYFKYGSNITITSSNGKGIVDGGGPQWWGLPFVGYLELQEHRPVLLGFNNTEHILMERILLRDSPYWTVNLENVNHAIVRDMSIINRRTKADGHDLIDLSAFNTDGIDISGHNIHVHDVNIWNQDDCIAVKDNYYGHHVSSNMTFERIHASGLGLVIGSIGGSTITNITFRDSYLHKTYKGIYLKFRIPNMTKFEHHGIIENVLFENITMEQPQQWPIWIGPAQQADSANVCAGNPCSLCWPMIPGAQCGVVDKSKYRNITLRNVVINRPKRSPGVLLGDEQNQIEGLVFENVVVTAKEAFGMERDIAFPRFSGQDDESARIRDPYVRRERFMIRCAIAIVALVAGCSIVLRRLRGRWRSGRQLVPTESADDDSDNLDDEESSMIAAASKEADSESEPRHWRRWRWKLFVGFLAISLVCGWIFVLRRRIHNTHRYFVCRGVSGGVAIGTTWPVPYCFHDQTNGQREL